MKFDELFGPSRRIRDRLAVKFKRTDFPATGPHKLLLFGAPGIGKTGCAIELAAIVDPKGFATTKVNGKEIGVDDVRKWRKHCRTMPLDAPVSVTIIDELDQASKDAQILMLSWIDWMPPFAVVIATSNLELEALQERLQTRFQQIRVEAPSDQDICDALRAKGLPPEEALRIATGAAGNARAAELDATTYFDLQAPAP